MAEEPTDAGFYRYDGGAQLLQFMLHTNGQWYIWQENVLVKCDWGYIEQALSVYNLVKMTVEELGGVKRVAWCPRCDRGFTQSTFKSAMKAMDEHLLLHDAPIPSDERLDD